MRIAQNRIDFPAYNTHGVDVFARPHCALIDIYESGDHAHIRGTTTLNRDPLLLQRLTCVAHALKAIRFDNNPLDKTPLKQLFAACSVGLDAQSQALTHELRGLKSGKDIDIHGVDISARFTACAREGYFPFDATDNIPDAWLERIVVDGKYTNGLRFEDMGITFHDAQDIRAHQERYDITVATNVLYHMDKDTAIETMVHLTGQTSSIIATDPASIDKHCDDLMPILYKNGFMNLTSLLRQAQNVRPVSALRENAESQIFAHVSVARGIVEMCGDKAQPVDFSDFRL